MKQLTLSITAIALLSLAACNKKDDPAPNNNNTTTSKKDLLVGGEWQWDGLWGVENPGASNETLTDAWASVKDCDKDDRVVYTADGKGTIDEKALKCDNDPQLQQIKWELINNETQIKITNDKGTYQMTIVELTATKAVYRQRVAMSATDSTTIQQSFKKI
jgi:hypothetical protein